VPKSKVFSFAPDETVSLSKRLRRHLIFEDLAMEMELRPQAMLPVTPICKSKPMPVLVAQPTALTPMPKEPLDSA